MENRSIDKNTYKMCCFLNYVVSKLFQGDICAAHRRESDSWQRVRIDQLIKTARGHQARLDFCYHHCLEIDVECSKF